MAAGDEFADPELERWLMLPSSQDAHEAEVDAATLAYLKSSERDDSHKPFVRALLPPDRKPTSGDWEVARAWAHQWRYMNFTPDEIRAWRRAGADADDAAIADKLVGEGIEPKRAQELALEPETTEPKAILDIARAYANSPYLSLSRALDRAGVERKRGARPSARGLPWAL